MFHYSIANLLHLPIFNAKIKLMSKGFTLVELIIVIAIISILSTIGVVVYFNILAQTRDSARLADLYAISTALEVNRTPQGYVSLQRSQFSSFSTVDPSGNVYCIASGSPPTPDVPEPWGSSCPSDFTQVAPMVPEGTFLSWKVCAYFEKLVLLNSTHSFCLTQKQ